MKDELIENQLIENNMNVGMIFKKNRELVTSPLFKFILFLNFLLLQ